MSCVAIGITKIGICTSNYPNRTVEITFLEQFWNLFYFLIVNNNQYLSHVVDNIIFKISLWMTVKSNSLWLFCNFGIFILLYIHMNNNKFTYDRFKTAKFWFCMLDMLLSSLLKLLTFFLNTKKRFTAISIVSIT